MKIIIKPNVQNRMTQMIGQNKILLITVYVFIFWIAFINRAAASLRPTEEQIEVVNQTIYYVFSDSFEQAYVMAESFERSNKSAPMATMLTAAVLLAEMTDDEDYDRKDQFFDAINSTTKTLKSYIDNNPDDPWGYFFLGSALGHKSVFYGLQKSWLRAFVNGMKAKNRFIKAVELDPHIYDAYTGTGNYHYWSSLRLRKYLPFLHDNKDRGLAELELAMDSSSFSILPAMGGLSWAFMYDKKLRQAQRLGKKLYAKTNGGRISLWILGGTCWRNGNLRMAEKYYSELIESLNRKGNQNNYNLIFCHYRRGVARFYRGRFKEAYDDLIEIEKLEVSNKVKKRHKKTYEKTNDYLERIEAKLESANKR